MNRIVRCNTFLACLATVYSVTVGASLGRTTPQQGYASENPVAADKVNRGEIVKTEGLIVTHHGDIVTMQTADSGNIEVVITDYTKVVTPQAFRKKQKPPSDLVPGLWIKVKGVGDSPSHVLAESVSFSDKDLKVARAIQAGLTPLDKEVQASQNQIQENVQNIQTNQNEIQTTQQQVSANQQKIGETNQRVSELMDYDVKYIASVYFPVASATLSAPDRNTLAGLARSALQLKGYFFEVKGFADSSGLFDLNQGLSIRRAQSVIAYLEDECDIPLTNVLTPAGMGETQPKSTNDTVQGRAQNRRVEIRVLVSRGLAVP